ncbi:MAG TPA: SDR family NAD(P)-dependent oxidoreductase [Burkholderiales bacterium]|nr:SDR family NAD(P)-dependent oxidoreductase [Burkholderiales bacterium]
MRFTDRVVVVTGAAGNLGRAVCDAFGREGATVVGLDVETNILDSRKLEARIQEIIENQKRIDIVCNIAGGFRMGKPVHETSDADWDFLFDLNVKSVRNMARAVVPHMLKAGGGKIVNVGAFAAQRGAAQMGAYVASKSAVIRLTEAMAAELREKNINVNCVMPTILDTPQNRADMPKADPAKWVALGDAAQAILFLASDDARAIHGAALPVTGLS